MVWSGVSIGIVLAWSVWMSAARRSRVVDVGDWVGCEEDGGMEWMQDGA